MTPQAHRGVQVMATRPGLEQRQNLLPEDRDVAGHYAARTAAASEWLPTNPSRAA